VSREEKKKMPAMARERRYPRVGLPRGMGVTWQSSLSSTVSRVATLGLGGLFITTPEPPAEGDFIRLLFEVPGGEVRARAVVRVSEQGKGMGVEFTAMSLEARALLDRLLQKLIGNGAPALH
jgi:hypothetical protein